MLEIKLSPDGDFGDQVLFESYGLGRIGISTSQHGSNGRLLTASEQASLLAILTTETSAPESLESVCSMFQLETVEVSKLARQGVLDQVPAIAMDIGFTAASVQAYMGHRLQVAGLLILEQLYDFCNCSQAALAADKLAKAVDSLPTSSEASTWLRKAIKCLADGKPATATIWLAKATVWLVDYYLVTNTSGKMARQLEEYREMVA